MKRATIAIAIIMLTTIACGVTSTATQLPTSTNQPAAASTAAPTSSSATQPPRSTSTPEPAVTEGSAPTATSVSGEPELTKTPYPTSQLDTQMANEVNLIQAQVIEERGLQPSFQVPVVLLSPDELRQNVTNDFLSDYTDEEMADDVLELAIIGLIEPGFDLKGFYTELLSEQVAGYYDDELGEMFVVRGEGFEGPEHLTYAHEYTHALQDQNYDIDKGLQYNDETCDLDTERCAAIQSLIEGDATLSEFSWFQNYATTEDQQQIIEYINSLDSPIYDSAPAFLQDDFVFPYNMGLSFVQFFYGQGGWDAVDALYQDPPVSTEQILHPERYPADKPIPVDLPDLSATLGDGWREITRNQMGEWYTFIIMARAADAAARLDDTIAQEAAAGWGGDEYLVLHNAEANATAFVMKTMWDSAGEAGEFASALEDYADARFGVSGSRQGETLTWEYADGYSSFFHSGDTTIWIITHDAGTAQAISDQVLP
jgi:hypothetical protein